MLLSEQGIKEKASDNTDAFLLEQMKGIEPSTAAWEAAVLPLNYICAAKVL